MSISLDPRIELDAFLSIRGVAGCDEDAGGNWGCCGALEEGGGPDDDCLEGWCCQLWRPSMRGFDIEQRWMLREVRYEGDVRVQWAGK